MAEANREMESLVALAGQGGCGLLTNSPTLAGIDRNAAKTNEMDFLCIPGISGT